LAAGTQGVRLVFRVTGLQITVTTMVARGLLLWVIGIPVPVITAVYLFHVM
jgi:hypothetical protein